MSTFNLTVDTLLLQNANCFMTTFLDVNFSPVITYVRHVTDIDGAHERLRENLAVQLHLHDKHYTR